MKIKAYAKINLTLDVTGRREDGYHTIDSVMQTIDVCDDLTLEKNTCGEIRLSSNKEYLPKNESNTAFRAAKLFFEECGLPGGVDIHIIKRIPSRAGMGGGSTDAAAVLHALNRMYERNLPLEQLIDLGRRVGADVPFCVAGGTCRCTGIGEICEPVPPMPDCALLICRPPAGVSTPKAYALMDRYPLGGSRATPRMLTALENGRLRDVSNALANRFDETMKLMQVRQVKKLMLGGGALGAMMTGSGSAVYGIFPTREQAEACKPLLDGKGKLFLSRPLNPEPTQ